MELSSRMVAIDKIGWYTIEKLTFDQNNFEWTKYIVNSLIHQDKTQLIEQSSSKWKVLTFTQQNIRINPTFNNFSHNIFTNIIKQVICKKCTILLIFRALFYLLRKKSKNKIIGNGLHFICDVKIFVCVK